MERQPSEKEIMMSKFVVVVLPDEVKAYEGSRAFAALHSEGNLTVYSVAVVTKDKDNQILVKDAAESGPLGIAVGAIVGGLIGIFGGPAGLLAGVAGGAVIGGFRDLFNLGLTTKFIEKISTELAPGKTAVIAEVDEGWETPLDSRMASIGGTVLRNWRSDFEDEQALAEIAARRADYHHLKSEFAHAEERAKDLLRAKVDQAKAELHNAESRAKARLEALEVEMKAKLTLLEKQISDAETSAKEKIQMQIVSLKSGYAVRTAKLKQAWDLTTDALAA
jgi:uncharacterized membrane protein